MSRFKTRDFLLHYFKDAGGVIAYLKGRDEAVPTEEAVKKWLQRDAIPGDYLGLLVGHLEKDRPDEKIISDFIAP